MSRFPWKFPVILIILIAACCCAPAIRQAALPQAVAGADPAIPRIPDAPPREPQGESVRRVASIPDREVPIPGNPLESAIPPTTFSPPGALPADTRPSAKSLNAGKSPVMLTEGAVSYVEDVVLGAGRQPCSHGFDFG